MSGRFQRGSRAWKHALTNGYELKPAASSVAISGTPTEGETLTGSYTYSDPEGNPEGTSTYRWLRSDVAIGGATSITYVLQAADVGETIKFEVTPVSSVAPTTGTAVQSAATAEIDEAAPAYPDVTAYYSSPGGAGDYADFDTNVAARAVFPGTAKPVCTIFGWAQIDVLGGAFDLFSVTDDGAPFLSLYATDDPFLQIVAINAAEDGGAIGGGAATFTGAWQPIVAVCDGADGTVYLGGIEIGSGALPDVNYATVDAFKLFLEGVGVTEKLANFGVQTRAWSPAEVTAHAAALVTADIRNVVSATGLAVYIRDAAVAGSVANSGSGGACALTFHGNVVSASIA